MRGMKILDYFYEKPPHFSHFNARRYKIEEKKTLLLGTRKSGITSIVADFLSNLNKEKYLYIDLHEKRFDLSSLEYLQDFIDKRHITHLCVEHVDEDFKNPRVENIIFTSNNLKLKKKGFDTLKVNPLNFEEFIGFNQRNFNSKSLFSLYANKGRFPKSANLTSFENKIYLHECLILTLHEDISRELFALLAKNQSSTYSYFKAYNKLKSFMKISKDKVYEKAKELEEFGHIYLLEKFNSPKSAKKIYLNNFAFKNALTLERDFLKRFENMVFCELFDEEIFYTDDIHFYLPLKNQALLCIPFLPPELILRRFLKLLPMLKKLHIKSVKVITLGNEGKAKKEGINCEILPFWQWALLLNQ